MFVSVFQGSPSRDAVTTNHIGRQRPSTKDNPVMDKHDEQYLSKSKRNSTKVSNREFNRWLSHNKIWNENRNKKVKYILHVL
jgi:hypothetical protein